VGADHLITHPLRAPAGPVRQNLNQQWARQGWVLQLSIDSTEPVIPQNQMNVKSYWEQCNNGLILWIILFYAITFIGFGVLI